MKRVCAVCETKPVVAAFKPFCSKRCADVDLSRWLKGGYAIPGLPADQADEAPGKGDSSEA
ncbi:MAG: DNA gyrase inhibitor YacG [Pseudomonadota bacterium]